MSIPDTPAIRKQLASGTATVTGMNAPKRKAGKVELVEASGGITDDGVAWWVIPLETHGEINGHNWKAKNRRAGKSWQAVRGSVTLIELQPFESCHMNGNPVYCRLTRIAPRKLDAMDNLPSSLKMVADVLSFLIGCDDSSPLWKPSCNQEVNVRYGVRIELSTEPFT